MQRAAKLLQTNLRIGSIGTYPSVPVHGSTVLWEVEVLNDGPGLERFDLKMQAFTESGTLDYTVILHSGYWLAPSTNHWLQSGDYTVFSGYTYKFTIENTSKPEVNVSDNVKTVDPFG